MDPILDQFDAAAERFDFPDLDNGYNYAVDVRLHAFADAGRWALIVDVLRRLVPDHREPLLADETELRRRIPADIPEILRLDSWHHPDLHRSRPSESPVLRQLADVLTTADPARYTPARPPNTHWSNWPDSGSL